MMYESALSKFQGCGFPFLLRSTFHPSTRAFTKSRVSFFLSAPFGIVRPSFLMIAFTVDGWI